MDSIVNRESKGVGVRQAGLNQLYESRAKRKGIEMMSDLSQYYNVLPSGRH